MPVALELTPSPAAVAVRSARRPLQPPGQLVASDALRVEDDTVLFDADRLQTRNGLTGRTNLSAVQCQEGTLLLVCLAPEH